MNIFGGEMTEEELKILDGDEPEEELGTLGELVEEEPVEEEVVEEVIEEPEPVAEPKVEIPEEPKPDAAAFARLRFEAKQARDEAERLKQAQQAKEEPEEQTFDQVVSTLIKEVTTLKNQINYREVESSARQEFASYEQAARAKLPDYDDAAEHMTKELRRSFSLVNPGATPQQITKLCDDYVLKRAAFALEQGIQPAEYLHHVAYKEFGFQPQREEAPRAEETSRKPDLAKLAANRKKSAGMAAAGGRGAEPSLTPEAALDMDNAAFSRLSPQEIDKLLASIQ